MTLQEHLRESVQKLRRTPMPIADVAPMLAKAADEIDALKAENELLRDLMKEAASNCKASIAEEGISDSRRVYRSELLHRLNAAMKGQP